MEQSKWFLRSKTIVGSLLIVLNSAVSLPFIPEEWRGAISGIIAVLVAIDRATGQKPSVTLLPHAVDQLLTK